MEELGEGPGMLMAAVDFAKADAGRSHAVLTPIGPGVDSDTATISAIC